ncbi:hypothetical protein C0991_003406 [Blastosporella zonata]|nr:hypothetical protein C0991_003406 [Blastosporella zonata]
MFRISILAVLALATFALASPLQSRKSKCHPNFEGVGVSVLWDQNPFNTREWSPNAVGANVTTVIDDFQQAAEFRFEQTGSSYATYIAKKLGVSANNQVVSVGSNEQYINIAYLSSGDPNQTWDVSCDVCGTNAWSVHGLFADVCTIKSVHLGLCAQVVTTVTHAHSAPSFLLQLAACNGAANQNFQFWMV